MNLTSIYLCPQPNATHVKYTSAQPFTPKFVKDHLTKKLPSFRAQALYDERVHRRQLGLTRRIQSQRTKAEKEKKKGLVKRVKMGRREAAEMGVWQLRGEEARCVPQSQKRNAPIPMTLFFFLDFQVGCVCPVALVMAWIYVGAAWIDDGGHAGAGAGRADYCSWDAGEGCDAFSSWDACQARQSRFSWLDYDRSVIFFPFLGVLFFWVDAGAGYDDTVRRSKNASLVGASGIVVQETENTFKVVTQKNKLKGERLLSFVVYVSCVLTGMPPSIFFSVLPKQGSVFAFAVPLYSTQSESESSRSASASAAAFAATSSGTNSGTTGRDDADAGAGAGGDDARETKTVLDGPHIEFELYGNQFCFRAADRAGRKFKHKETIEL